MQDFLVKSLEGCNDLVVAIDPGETTGICTFKGSTLLHIDQLPTNEVVKGAMLIDAYIAKWNPPTVVVEDYRVYAWKTEDHTWQHLHTPQFIGAIKYLCALGGRTVVMQMAQQAKGFVTDSKLQAWGLFEQGQRHSRDAMRHAIYYLLFNVAKVQSQVGSK